MGKITMQKAAKDLPTAEQKKKAILAFRNQNMTAVTFKKTVT